MSKHNSDRNCVRGQKGQLNRDLSKKNYPWLDRDYYKGEMVYKYTGNTYGCISSTGQAVTEIPGQYPFFEVPSDSVDWNLKQ